MGDIFFGNKEVNGVIAAHASEAPALDRLLQQGRDDAYRSNAKLEDTHNGQMLLTTNASDRPQIQQSTKMATDPVRDTSGVLEFAKNEANARTYDPNSYLTSSEKVVISVPRQLVNPFDSNPQLNASVTDTVKDRDGHVIKKFEAQCSTRPQNGDLHCRGEWRDGNNRFIIGEEFSLSAIAKSTNYYDRSGRRIGSLQTSIQSTNNGATTQTKIS